MDLLCTRLGLVPSIYECHMWHVSGFIDNSNAHTPPCSRVAITDACILIQCFSQVPYAGPGLFTCAYAGPAAYPAYMTALRCFAANLEVGFVIYAENCPRTTLGAPIVSLEVQWCGLYGEC